MASRARPQNRPKPIEGKVVLHYDRMPEGLQAEVDKVHAARRVRSGAVGGIGGVMGYTVAQQQGIVRGALTGAAATMAAFKLLSHPVVEATMNAGKVLKKDFKPHADMMERDGAYMVYINGGLHFAATENVPLAGGYPRIVLNPEKLTETQRKRLRWRGWLPEKA